MTSLGIYIQVPFCASKCSFCNFSSKVAPERVFDGYCEALEKEIANLPSILGAQGIPAGICDLTVDTLYFGGGTPPILGAGRLRHLVEALRGRFDFTDHPEFTIEVTPGSAGDALLCAARDFGMNRLSIGAQSFDDHELRSVGRLHSSSDTRELVRAARRAEFANISLDLIAGLPHQTQSSWQASVRAALDLEPEHISVYLFEIDEKSRLGGEVLRHGTRYHAGEVPGDDFMADAYEAARERLSEAGYAQYEISNFALPRRESRHNQKYWRLDPYIGLGAGAHSFDGVRRWANETSTEAYQDKIKRGESPIADRRELSRQEQLEEFFFLGLRQTQGVHLEPARRRWGHNELAPWESKLGAMARHGWIKTQDDRVCLRDEVYLVSNEVFQEFLNV